MSAIPKFLGSDGRVILAPQVNSGEINDANHYVQFYESDDYLIDSLAEFVANAHRRGEPCVLVATKEHRRALKNRLQRINGDAVKQLGDYCFDAAKLLSKFMVNGSPNGPLFERLIGGILLRAGSNGRRVRVFGEMVAILWAEKKYEAAIQLENLWNNLHKEYSFSLFCAYPMSGFAGKEFAAPLSSVCMAHSRVVPAESYAALHNAEDRLREILLLQQKANCLEKEIAEHIQTEQELRSVKEELEHQVEDLRRLNETGLSLTSTLEVDLMLDNLLNAALAVHGTEMGLLSLADEHSDGIRVRVSKGFEPEFLNLVKFVPTGSGACGSCFEKRDRVIVEDVEQDPVFAEYKEGARAAGFRACHSTPLVTRSGNVIGVLSVHFRNPYRPTERQMRLMDLYARMAADLIENANLHFQLQQQLREREALLACEQRARLEAESANRMKDEFLATVSHELRTPLTSILGWTRLLRSGAVHTENHDRALETIERNVKAQTQLIEDLLDVSRIITGKLRLEMAPLDLESVVEAAINAVRPAADAKNTKIYLLYEAEPAPYFGDAERLQQVIWNLLANAIKFTQRNGLVEIRLRRLLSEIEISVTDNGQGISPEFLPFVFDRFRQADGSNTRKHGGLGLGLAIVRHLVELHGGAVQAESRGKGLGSTFRVKLPATPLHTETTEIPTLLKDVASSESPESLKGIRVLIVEGEPDARELLTILLRQREAEATAVASSEEAFKIMEFWVPDVLISEIGMPGDSGYNLIRKIRSLPPESGGRIPALALTSYARLEDRIRAISEGFNMHIAKPVEPDELAAVVASLANWSKPRS